MEYKAKLIDSIPNNNNISDSEVATPLKYLIHFWRSFDFPLINCEKELDLSWSKECIISETSVIPRIAENQNANPPVQEVAAQLSLCLLMIYQIFRKYQTKI